MTQMLHVLVGLLPGYIVRYLPAASPTSLDIDNTNPPRFHEGSRAFGVSIFIIQDGASLETNINFDWWYI